MVNNAGAEEIFKITVIRGELSEICARPSFELRYLVIYLPGASQKIIEKGVH